MKNLLIEEMKRAIEIMESKPEIKTMKRAKDDGYSWLVVDRETSELKRLLLSIRKHSVLFEKTFKG